MRQWREANKEKAAFHNLKSNSTRRNKLFDLTLEQFLLFCYCTNYIAGKGKTKESLSIDCYENEKGYTISNIRPLPLAENARKGTKSLQYDWQTKTAFVVNHSSLIPQQFSKENYF